MDNYHKHDYQKPRRRKKWLKRGAVLTCIIAIAATTVFYFSGGPALAASTVGTTSSSSATSASYQRKTFWDDVNNLYWAFFYNGTNTEYFNSPDGTTWTSRGTTSPSSNLFSVWYANVSGTPTVYITYISSGVKVNKGTLGPTSITFGTAQTADASATSINSISRDGNGRIWITYTLTSGIAGNFTFTLKAIRATNADDITQWGTGTSLGSASSASQTTLAGSQVIPLSTAGNMLIIWEKDDANAGLQSLNFNKWTDSGSTMSSSTTIVSGANVGTFSAVGSPVASDAAYLIYIDSGVKLRTYTSGSPGSFGSATTIDSGTDSSPSLSFDSTNTALYAFFISSNAVKSTLSITAPFTSWATPVTQFSTGTNTNLTSSYANGNSTEFAIWTNGSTAVKFASVPLEQSPDAPVLQSPTPNNGNGAANTTTPGLPLSATDQNGEDVRYEVLLDPSNTFTTATADSDSTTSNSVASKLSTGNNTAVGHSFVGDGRFLNNIQIRLSKTGSPTGNAVMKLYALTGTDGTNATPNGAALATSANLDVSTLGSVPGTKTFTFSGTSGQVALVSGTHYFWSVEYSGGNAGTDYVNVYTTNASSHSGNGALFSGSWASSSNDYTFTAVSGPIDVVSGTDTGFSGSPDNSDPFASGQTVTYTVQSSQALTRGATYYWKARGIDPTGSNIYGSYSSVSSFTVDSIPAAPTLIKPASGNTKTSTLPQFELRTSDADGDYTQYFIQIYDATACGGSQVGSDIDQSSSQTGWQNQDSKLVSSAYTAYNSLASVSNSTIARYQYNGTLLSPNHLYSWRAKAIDPDGSNTYSSLTSCQDFTTSTGETKIQGGVNITGGSRIQ